MSEDIALTRQLRELHRRLDPGAPRHMSNGQRKAAIQQLLGGVVNGGDEGNGNDGTATDGGAEGGAGAGPAKAGGKKGAGSRKPREAHGVSLPGTDPAPKPAGRQRTQRSEPERNIDRIWRYLFGE